MPDENKWASFVRAHRLAQNLNQGEFAQLMGVSQQTVSRWESGGQIPDLAIQDKLRHQLQATALGSIAFWKHRVSSSHGHEVLIDRDVTVLAASRRAVELFQAGAATIDGIKLPDLLPSTEIPDHGPMGLTSINQFREIGFFDGLVRSIRLDAEWHLEVGSCACRTDVWPILTSEQTIIGQFVGAPTPIAKDAGGFMGIRVRRADVRLNRDRDNE